MLAKDNTRKPSLSPEITIILTVLIFLVVCIFLDINILQVDKTGFYKSPQAYDTYVLKKYFLFIYIPVLLFIMSVYTFLNKKAHNLEELGKITLYSYGILTVFAIVKIIYILIMPSKTPSSVWFLMPPALYDILKGLGEIHILYFLFALTFCIFIFSFISKFMIKFIHPIVYIIIYNGGIAYLIYEFLKLCIFLDELFDVTLG